MEEHEQEEVVKVKKSTMWKAGTVVFGVLFIISLFTGGFGIKSGDGGAPEITGGTVRDVPDLAPTIKLDMDDLVDDDATKGNKNAKVTIVEWSDFECSFCARFYRDTLGKIEEQYIKTGKVKFVYRDFPLGFHPNAQKAAEAAECAGEQNKFWEMHDMLFENGVTGGVSSFKQFAKTIGLNSGKFDECLDSGTMAGEVAKDMSDGIDAGIQGTPGFIVNGLLVSGAQPFENFKQIIDAALAA